MENLIFLIKINKRYKHVGYNIHARIQKVLSEGANFDLVIFYNFLVDEGREGPNTILSGPSLTRQRNVVEMALRLRADDGPTLKAGLVAL